MTPIDRTWARYRAALCGSTLLMVTMTWPLWLDDSNFPRTPFFSIFPNLPSFVAVVVLAVILMALSLASLGVGGRKIIGASLALLGLAVIQDQNRLQPWVYQDLVIGLALTWVSKPRALRMARWYTIGLYFYSGLSKLDASFCQELGRTFLAAAVEPLGISTESWPETVKILAILAMPGFEIVVAGLLGFARTRRLGLIGSIAQHAALIAILGPWNLGHSSVVLVWNLAQIVENLVLFGPTDAPETPTPDSKLGPLIRLIFWVLMILPVGERLGFCDAWPAHALYASHAERSDVFLHEDEWDRFPKSIQRRLGPANASPWRRLDLTGWSRDVRGTPTYPSGRVGNAVAEFLETHYGGIQPVRLVQSARASLWDNRRVRDESLGLKAIRRRADRFLLNAHPAP